MRHHNSVFHGVLKAVPWDVFDRLVEEHEADWRVRRLSTKSQFVALLYGQLEGAVSLREIAAGLERATRAVFTTSGPRRRGARRWPTPTRCARARCLPNCLRR